MTKHRESFREQVFNRDNHTCLIPWCNNEADDAHHIIERTLWETDHNGYTVDNGASVCTKHHKYAEDNHIPPQAFYKWAEIDSPPKPSHISDLQTDKWGREFNTPRWENQKDEVKYQSTSHLLPLYWNEEDTFASNRIERDDTEITTIEPFIGVPLIITEKMDGGNCMIVNDTTNPVRARNGSSPTDSMKTFYQKNGLYWTQNVPYKLDDNLQVFGEWLYAKHSIHYGCDCDETCEDTAPSLSEHTGKDDETSLFQIFGVYDRELNMWLSWPKTKEIAQLLGFPTTPIVYEEDDADNPTFTSEQEAINTLLKYAHKVVKKGGEGIVVRTKYPYHYGQFSQRLGKYVRENHVKSETHCRHQKEVPNVI